jgi:DnaK suppressor protein
MMTEAERGKFKSILEEKQAVLSGSLCSREEIAIEKAPDTLDATQLAGEREVAIRNLDRDSQMLRQIHDSLIRIADGSYGICQRCEDEISLKRIQALPWAAFCITCQEKVDALEIPAYDSWNLFTTAA